MARGVRRPVANRLTLKPGSVWGRTPSGRATMWEAFDAEGVAFGAGRSAGVIWRITPGFSVRAVEKELASAQISRAHAAVPSTTTAILGLLILVTPRSLLCR